MFEKYKKPKIGLVLNGGGARGPFQFGVYLGLIKYGLDKNIVGISSASIGAFNMVFFLLQKPDLILKLWRKVDNQLVKQDKSTNIISRLSSSLITKKEGFYSRDNLKGEIKKNLDLDGLLKDKFPLYVSLAKCQFNSKGKVEKYLPSYVKLNDMDANLALDYLLASSAIPMVFDPVTILNETYVDPMKADNEPYKPLMDLNMDYLCILPLNSSHLEKKYPKDFKFHIIDFSCPELFKMKKMNMLDFSKDNQDFYISLGYQTADLLLSLIQRENQLHKLTKKQLNQKEKKYFSLENFNIIDISFKSMSLEEIEKDINSKLNKKEKIRL